MINQNTDGKEARFEDLLNQIKEIRKKCESTNDHKSIKAKLKNLWFNLALNALDLVDAPDKAQRLLELAPSPNGYIANTIKEKNRNLQPI